MVSRGSAPTSFFFWFVSPRPGCVQTPDYFARTYTEWTASGLWSDSRQIWGWTCIRLKSVTATVFDRFDLFTIIHTEVTATSPSLLRAKLKHTFYNSHSKNYIIKYIICTSVRCVFRLSCFCTRDKNAHAAVCINHISEQNACVKRRPHDRYPNEHMHTHRTDALVNMCVHTLSLPTLAGFFSLAWPCSCKLFVLSHRLFLLCHFVSY